MVILVMLVMTAAAIAAVGYPFYRRPDGPEREESGREDLTRDKERVLRDIRDLEFDLETGKLSEHDYDDMRLDFETEAVAVLKAIEQVGNGSTTAVRSRMTAGVEVESEARFCTQCGTASAPGNRFCRACGHPLKGEA